VEGRVAAAVGAAHAEDAMTGRLEVDLARLLGPASWVLRYAAESGPEMLAGFARARQQDAPAVARSRLVTYWSGSRQADEDYLSRAMLRPYVEFLRTAGIAPDRDLPYGLAGRGRCPFCGGAPWVSARREGSLTEGARRTLACSLCGLEWTFERIRCPYCFEEDPKKLPSFSHEGHASARGDRVVRTVGLVRIDACETCRRYIKSIDLSEDARPIPEVDDLATIAMDLWAVAEGFTRIEPGLAGL
jgi:formate dehydrogenase accessory protein FdhE